MTYAPAVNPRIAWLTPAERTPSSLGPNGTLRDAMAQFQKDSDLRLLAVVDARGQPRGAIFERDVRRLLLNPFGHALLQNPTINAELAGSLRPCPVHEVTADVAALVDHYRRCDGREGMILTRSGRLFATISNRRLLLLAAEAEARAGMVRLARAERIANAGARFETGSATSSTQMIELADAVQRLAAATADRSTIASNRASAVATAAVQTRNSMDHVADRGASLAGAFSQIEQSLAGSRRVAADTAARVGSGADRSRALLAAAGTIDQVMALVAEIAGKVNLLSLNASIEVARAGAAGAGFAVVAAEVRFLSDQTHAATDAISDEVQALRSGIEQVARDYSDLEQSIALLIGSNHEIDRAITAEADTTRSIARSVGEAGIAAAEIEASVATIVRSVGAASTSAQELDALASDLRRGAQVLDSEVTSFLEVVRAA